ncbi:MAG: hypothetical protein HN719_03540 [Alphaproteobacteria bacterium]|jgi:hypothetical protein|nr:hypothetical protein [Alphaproteobacteria bacterium]
MMKISALKSFFFVALASVFLSSCYIPIRFDAEIEIHRTGAYDMKFDGYLASVELYKGIKEGKISPAEESKKKEIIRVDFARDPSVKEFKYFKQGHFKVNWHRNGDLIRTKSVSFVNSTSEYIIGMRYNKKTRKITVSTKSVAKSAKKQLQDLGLDWSGKLRVFTDAKVLSHNATTVKKNKRLGGRFMTYTWDIKNIFAPTSSMVLQIY